MSRFERRVRRLREVPFGSVRRKISSTCWAARKESATPSRPGRVTSGAFGCGANGAAAIALIETRAGDPVA